jgi:carboxypeptidase C (cathepsin A)
MGTFSHSLSVIPISRAVGHMVPKDQPKVALDMLKQFLNQEPFYSAL